MMTSFGWAKYPMIKRVTEIDPSIPISMIYGSRSWMDSNMGYEVKYLRNQSFVDVQVCNVALLRFLKVCLHVTFLIPCPLYIFLIVIRIMDRMGLSSILSIICTITVFTVLNNNSGNNTHELKNFTCKETLSLH